MGLHFRLAYCERKLTKACQEEHMESRGLRMGHSLPPPAGIAILQKEGVL